MTDTPTTTKSALLVAGTSFSLSCAAFAISVLLLIPITGTLLQSFPAPAFIQQAMIVLCLFGFPVAAAIQGIDIGAKLADVPQLD